MRERTSERERARESERERIAERRRDESGPAREGKRRRGRVEWEREERGNGEMVTQSGPEQRYVLLDSWFVWWFVG